MRFTAFLLLIFLMISSVQAQDPEGAANPLATLKDEVKNVLADASLPFSEEQDRAIVLMMEDRRKASEELFGSLMDFTAGPTQGQESDRLRSAIDWMRNEFLTQLQNYLRPEQLAAWSRYREATTVAATSEPTAGRAAARPRPSPSSRPSS